MIDVQNEYVTGELPIEYPDLRLSLRNIGRAMDAARAHAIPVAVVQNSAPSDARLFANGTPACALHAVVRTRARDHYLEKSLPSAFAGTELGSWLERERIDTLSVIGYMTHNCVDSTVKHALHAGLTAECLYNATGSVSYANRAGRAGARRIHDTVSVVMHSRFAAVLNTDDWLQLLTSPARHDPRLESAGTLAGEPIHARRSEHGLARPGSRYSVGLRARRRDRSHQLQAVLRHRQADAEVPGKLRALIEVAIVEAGSQAGAIDPQETTPLGDELERRSTFLDWRRNL